MDSGAVWGLIYAIGFFACLFWLLGGEIESDAFNLGHEVGVVIVSLLWFLFLPLCGLFGIINILGDRR